MLIQVYPNKITISKATDDVINFTADLGTKYTVHLLYVPAGKTHDIIISATNEDLYMLLYELAKHWDFTLV